MGEPLAQRTTRAQAERVRGVLLIPVGSCEQHGPHLPLGTDSIIAETICADVMANHDVDVAPTVPFSASGEHEGFAGLLSIGTETTAAVLTELVRSARASWSGVIIISGHGGNADALARVARVAQHEGDKVAVWLPTHEEGDPHAGASETSVMMTIQPFAVGELPEGVDLTSDWVTRVREGGMRAVSESGVLGHPRRATVEEGWRLRRRWCGEVEELIRQLRGEL